MSAKKSLKHPKKPAALKKNAKKKAVKKVAPIKKAAVKKPIKKSKRLRQDVFCDLFFNTKSPFFLNAYQSAIKVGYSPTTAKDILFRAERGKKDNTFRVIQARLKEFKEKFQDSSITVEKVLLKLNHIIDLLDDPVELKVSGGSMSDILKALEMCGKFLKMWTPEVDQTPVFVLNILPPK